MLFLIILVKKRIPDTEFFYQSIFIIHQFLIIIGHSVSKTFSKNYV